MRLQRPGWLTPAAIAFLLPSLLIGFATVALAASTAKLPGDPTKGATTYASSTCGTCHGSTLGGGVGPPLDPIKNLGDTKDPLDPAYLITTITGGKSGKGGYGTMPAKGGSTLSDQDIKDIASFIIQQNSIKGPKPLAPGPLAISTITWVTIGTLAMLALTYLLSRYNMRWIARKAGRP